MSGLIAIASEALAASINPLGAELWSLTDRAGREYMTDADPAFWTGRAPLLFPIVGALNGGHYRVDGQEFALPKHGFARTSSFELIEHETDGARFRLAERDGTLAVYPFRFELDMAFRLAGETLSMA
ncbi:MAG TPA: aldose 1-epimerase family protein, partial [Croceibacterium sp.]